MFFFVYMMFKIKIKQHSIAMHWNEMTKYVFFEEKIIVCEK